MTLIARLRHAWLVLRGRAIAIDTDLSAAVADARTTISGLVHACNLMELPMPLIDEINHLDTLIAAALAGAGNDAAALAAANQSNADLSAKLDAATAENAELQSQIAQATSALQALEAKYAPPATA